MPRYRTGLTSLGRYSVLLSISLLQSRPPATENKPSVTTGNMMFSFMHEDTICDWARFIFLKMVDFRDVPTQTRMPFPCLISAIVRAAGQGGQLAAK